MDAASAPPASFREIRFSVDKDAELRPGLFSIAASP
jgi:hypothetical protein